MTITSSATPKTMKLVDSQRKGSGIKRWQLNLGTLFCILLAVALLTAGVRAISSGEGLLWLVKIPPFAAEIGAVATVLAPFLAIAVAIERLLETFFSWYEQSIRSISDIVSEVRKPVDWIEEELKKAYEATEKAANATGADIDESGLASLAAAESRLAKAEQRLHDWVKAPDYVAWKRALSIWIGLFIGLEMAIFGDLAMLHAIGIPTPRILDMLITGFAIGAGPGPMHSLIGILQGGKDALKTFADTLSSKSIRDAASELKHSVDSV